MVARLGLEPFTMFEFAGIGVVMAIAGIIWLVLFDGRLIPDRASADLGEDYWTQIYLSALIVPPGSRAGQKAWICIDRHQPAANLTGVKAG